ncbi:hypothetical protein K439DRAFT_1665153, partial [Ramaria rubella]
MDLIVQQGAVSGAQNLQKAVDSRPFIHQLDVILTDSEEAASSLASLSTSYYRSRITFTTLFHDFATPSASTTTALSVGHLATEDVWCLDTRGVISLSLTKATYESLGVGAGINLGRKLKYLVKLDLRDNSTLALRTRNALEKWDIRRAGVGEDAWDVLLSSQYSNAGLRPESCQEVKAYLQTMPIAWVPQIPRPIQESSREDLAGLFEWVGLACLGSLRLSPGDTVSPYAAAYEPPSGSSAGTITHLRWTGFLPLEFVKSVLEQ